jgi:hypothetical protein
LYSARAAIELTFLVITITFPDGLTESLRVLPKNDTGLILLACFVSQAYFTKHLKYQLAEAYCGFQFFSVEMRKNCTKAYTLKRDVDLRVLLNISARKRQHFLRRSNNIYRFKNTLDEQRACRADVTLYNLKFEHWQYSLPIFLKCTVEIESVYAYIYSASSYIGCSLLRDAAIERTSEINGFSSGYLSDYRPLMLPHLWTSFHDMLQSTLHSARYAIGFRSRHLVGGISQIRYSGND